MFKTEIQFPDIISRPDTYNLTQVLEIEYPGIISRWDTYDMPLVIEIKVPEHYLTPGHFIL